MRIVTTAAPRLISAFCLISILPLVFINLMSYYNTTGIVQENTDELAGVNLVQTDKSVRSTLAAYEDLLFQLYTGDDIVNDVDELNAEEMRLLRTSYAEPFGVRISRIRYNALPSLPSP